jgi:hypothetical protein
MVTAIHHALAPDQKVKVSVMSPVVAAGLGVADDEALGDDVGVADGDEAAWGEPEGVAVAVVAVLGELDGDVAVLGDDEGVTDAAGVEDEEALGDDEGVGEAVIVEEAPETHT